MMQDYSIEQYKETDLNNVLELMQEIFVLEKMKKSEIFNLDYWNWQYQENPYGQAITILAKGNGRVIGQYANIPGQLKFNGQVLNSALVIDLMVKESYRRQGLFRKMGEISNAKLSERGFSISLAFPSRYDSYIGFIKKLGWFKIGDLSMLVKPICPWIFKSQEKVKVIELRRISEFPEEINNLWEQLKSNIPIGIARNKDYLNWRYSKNPTIKYETFLIYKNNSIVGYFIIRFINMSGFKFGLIVDMLCLSELEIMKAAIFKISDLCLAWRAYFCGILKTKLYQELLSKLGFRLLPYYISPKNYTLIARINQENLELDGLKNIDNWYLTFGDWDVV